MKAACIQMNISLCSKHEKLKHFLSMVDEAVLKEAELLVFPEVFSTGFCYDPIRELAEIISWTTLEALRALSKEYNFILAVSTVEKRING